MSNIDICEFAGQNKLFENDYNSNIFCVLIAILFVKYHLVIILEEFHVNIQNKLISPNITSLD